MNELSEQELIKQALMLDIADRTQFVEAIKHVKLKKKIEFLLQDDTHLTDFFIDTASGAKALKQPDVSDLKPGDKIQRILIIKLIAKGGMGSVYLAYDERLKRNVAVKTIRSDLMKNKASRQRFEQEAQILSQINHPSICQIYDYIEAEQGDLLVLELVQGCTLKSCNLSYDDLLETLIQISSALCAAHAKGVVHRDLKPDNIMLSDEGQIKVLDFGIAKSQAINATQKTINEVEGSPEPISQNITKIGSLMGTLVYMSPEQASTLPITEASDMYSLGIIMQELLTGESAYRLENTEDLRNQVINATPVPADSLSQDFQQLILALTQKTPSKRPGAEQVLARLKKIKQKPQKIKAQKRNWMFATLIVTLLVFLLWQWQRFGQKEAQLKWISDIRTQFDNQQSQLNQIYLLPKHDITDDLVKLEQRQSAAIEKIKLNTTLSAAQTSRLLGESHFAVGGYDQAVGLFQKAWNLGDKSPQLAALLAKVHDFLYWQNTYQLTHSGLSEHEMQQLQKINEQHLKQALSYYQADANVNRQQPSLITAHVEFFAGNYQQALDTLDLKLAVKSGDFLVFEFAGRVHRTLYDSYIQQGETEQALGHLKQAENSFRQAISSGRSYPASYSSLCHVRQLYMEHAIFRTGENPTQLYQDTINDCQLIFDITPNDHYAFNSMATNAYRMAEWNIRNGVDADATLAEALRWNEQAMQLKPDAQSYETKAIIYDVMALQKQESGQNPIADIEVALEAYQKVLAVDPTRVSRTTGNIFYAMVVKFQYMVAHGQSLDRELKFIAELLEKEQASPYKSASHYSSMYGNLGYVYLLTAQSMRQNKQPVNKWIAKSQQAYSKTIEVAPSSPFAYAGLADNQVMLAEIAFDNQQDVTPYLAEADKLLNQSLEISEKFYWPILTQGNVEKLKVRIAQKNNQDPSELISVGHKYFKQSLSLNNLYAPTHVFHAELYYLQMQSADNPAERKNAFESGIKAIDAALLIDRNLAEAWLLKSRFAAFAQDYDIKSPLIKLSYEALIDQANAINPKAMLGI